MGRPTTKPGNRTPAVGNASSWKNINSFVKNCVEGKYVLVVGNDAVLKMDENIAGNGNSSKYLYHLTTEYLNSNDDQTINPERLKNFTQLSRSRLHIDCHECVRDMTEFYNEDEVFNIEKVDDSLMSLLETKCFRIVITTTVDPFVKKAMERVWGEGKFRIMSLWDDKNDLRSEEIQTGELEEFEPILYYAFGNFFQNSENECEDGDEIHRFVLTENDAMEAVSKWFSEAGPRVLKDYIREKKRILSVGCSFDDWLFRFFWFILVGNVSRLRMGQVAIELDEQRDEKLLKFFENEGIKYFPKARPFMKEAADGINEAIKVSNLPRDDNGIFISYARENKMLALYLFWKLHNEGLGVWIDDEKLEPGDNFKKYIGDAIGKCKVFIPIICSQVRQDLENGNYLNRYYYKEWIEADSTRKDPESKNPYRLRVLPVIVGGHEQEKDYDKFSDKLPECMRVTYSDMRINMNSDKLVKKVKDLYNDASKSINSK